MRKMMKTLVPAAILAGAIAVAASGCGKKEAASETTAETQAAGQADAAGENTEVEDIDAIIAALDPQRPAELGTVKLGEYTGLSFKGVLPYKVTDADVEEYIKDNLTFAYTEEVDDAIQDGDIANIDYKGLKDGVAFAGGTAEGYDLAIGSGTFIDGFEAGLVGVKAGEKVDLNLTFPENYGSEELAGQDVVFEVTVNAVKRQSELTDEIAAEVSQGDCQTADELRELIRGEYQDYCDRQAMSSTNFAAADAVVKNSEVTPTEEAIDWQLDQYIISYNDALMQDSGVGLSYLMMMYGMEYDAYRDMMKPSVEASLKCKMVLDAIADEMNMEASDEAIAAYADKLHYDLDMLLSSDRAALEEVVREDLANQYIVDNSNVDWQKSEKVDF